MDKRSLDELVISPLLVFYGRVVMVRNVRKIRTSRLSSHNRRGENWCGVWWTGRGRVGSWSGRVGSGRGRVGSGRAHWSFFKPYQLRCESEPGE